MIDPLAPPKVGELFTTTELWDGYMVPVEYSTRVRNYGRVKTKHELVLEYSQSENPSLTENEVCWGVSTINFDTATKKCSATWANKPPSKIYDGTAHAKLISADTDLRQVYVSTLRLKREQEKFKGAILSIEKACELTGETETCALDAAHIVEVKDAGGHDPTNGLLLRTDIHRLFDRRLLRISHINGKVTLSPKLSTDSNYHEFLKGLQLKSSSLKRVCKKLEQRNKGN